MPDGKFIMPPDLVSGSPGAAPDKPTIKMEAQPGWRSKLATTSRVLGSMAGSLAATEPGLGTAIGAGLGGGGEAIAQLLEDGKLNKARIGVEAGLAAIPGGALISKGKVLKSALKGAGIAQLGNSLRRWSQGGSAMPEASDLGSAVIGGAVGGTVGKFTKAPTNPVSTSSATEAVAKELQANLEQAKPPTEPKLVSNKTQGLVVARPEVKVTQPTRGAASVEMVGEGQVDSPAIQEAKRRALKPPSKGSLKYSPVKEALYNSGVEADKIAEATREAHRAAAANQQKTSIGMEKAHEVANRLRSSEEVAASKAQQSVLDANAKAAQNEANAAEIRAAIEAGEMIPKPPSISETVSADVGGAKQRMSTQFASADELAEEAAAAEAKAAKAVERQQVKQAKAETASKKQALVQEKATAKTRASLEKEAAQVEKAAAKPGKKPGDLISGFFNQLDAEQAAAKAAKPVKAAPPTGAMPVVEPALTPAPAPVPARGFAVAKAAEPVPVSEVIPEGLAPEAAPQITEVAPKTAAPPAAAQLAEKLAVGQAPSVNPRTTALQSTLEALPPDHPVASLIKAEMAAGEAYGQAKAAAEGAAKGSPESAASRRAGVEARLAREATDAALTQAGMEPIVAPKAKAAAAVPEPPPVLEGEVMPEAPPAPTPKVINGLKVQTGKLIHGPVEAQAAAPAAPPLPVKEGQILAAQEAPKVGNIIQKLVQDESGQAAPAMAIRMGTTAAGAILGYMTDPLGDPFSSAVAGGGLGLAAGLGITPANTPGLAEATSGREARAAIAAKLEAAGSKILHTLPDYQRFSYLSSVQGLIVNGIIGPYGSAVMGAIEHIAQKDPRGYAALKAMNPVKFLSYMQQVRPEAEDILLKAEGHLGEGIVSKILVSPGEFLTMGDLAAERILIESGFGADEAARMLLKNEPLTATGLNIAHFPAMETEGGKSALLLKLALPFKRTLANYFEQGLERTPGLGYFAQKAKDIPDSFAAQLAQQGIGGVMGGIGFVLGAMFPIETKAQVGEEQATSSRETANLVRKTISNFAGPYGMPTTMGFAAGQAFASQKSIGKSMLDAATRSAPMPSLEYIGSFYDAATSVLSGEAEDPIENLRRVGVVPSFFSRGTRELLGAGVGAALGGQAEQDPAGLVIPVIQAPTIVPPNINIP